ncbi:Dabb family protein [Magnetofaba australis]|nr:Dabb family protein [Magnetofaba australis]
MIHHYVFWEIQGEGEEKIANVRTIKHALESMGHIPGVLSLEVSLNAKVDALSKEIDLMLYTTHVDWADLEAYQAHSEHKKVIEIVRPRRKNRWAVDYET